MSHNIDVLGREGIYNSEKLLFKEKVGQQTQEEENNQLHLTETYRLPITVVFWDISGFSRLAKIFYELDQEDFLLEFLEKYYRIARNVINSNNGVWDKAIGDGVMSWFGSFDIAHNEFSSFTINSHGRNDNDDGALNAAKAAIELRSRFKCLKNELRNEWTNRLEKLSVSSASKKNLNCKDKRTLETLKRESQHESSKILPGTPSKLPDFDLKCGINTGAARICLLYNQFTAVGTNVNLASRLQEFAQTDQIVISSSTRRKIRNEKIMIRKIILNSNNTIKSFEDTDCCYEII